MPGEPEQPKKLTPKQAKFCHEYVQDLNATQAAIRAGYSAKTAYSIGQRLLKNVEIQAGIREAQKEFTAKLDITPEKVLREWANLAFANMQDYTHVDDDGNPRIDLSECTREQMAALSETQTESVVEGTGKTAQVVRKVKIKFHSKTQALEALSKHLGLFETHNKQLNGNILDKIMGWVADGSGDSRNTDHEADNPG